MRGIVVNTIPHKEQRYNTCGDWEFDDYGYLNVKVSDTGNWRYNMVIAIHEIAEALACKHQGITTKQVDDFDMAWKEHDGIGEPGADPKAPYYYQHLASNTIEQILYLPYMLDIKPENLEKEIDKLDAEYSKEVG